MPTEIPIVIATRGSPLALAQANQIAEQCRKTFPHLRFELKIIKTTGDKLQKASMAKVGESLPKGLFPKELEVALLKGQADLAVHSLKDLPTDLPDGLILAATPKRENVHDVLIYRDAGFFSQHSNINSQQDWVPRQSSLKGFQPHSTLEDFPAKTIIGTSSMRRKMSLLAARPDLKVVEVRGNVTGAYKKSPSATN